MKSINIKGKNYFPVNERLKSFRAEKQGYALITEILSIDEHQCTMIARVVDPNGFIVATGHAHEEKDDKTSMVNKTSYVENCETSAWGRALSACGIAGDAVASYEEVANAKLGQEQITKEEADSLVKYAKSLNVPTQDISSYFNVKDIKDLTKVDYAKATRMLNDIRRNK